MTQKFKGDAIELQMEAAGSPAFDSCDLALDEFFENCYDASDFLLALYDSGRMPFSDRVPRDSFVDFIRNALPNFPVTGSYESYIFIVNAIFGAGSGIYFDPPVAGKLSMLVNAAASLEFGAVAREFSGVAYDYFDLITMDGDGLQFRGVSGIDSEPKLKALLAELIPGGISPTITLDFFALYSFEASTVELIIDHLGNQIVFFET